MLELNFYIEPDADGVFDGRELAHALVQTAYAFLTPYVETCPACANALFSAIANGAIEQLHRDGDGLPGRTMCMDPDPDGAQWRSHLAATKALTEALLGPSDHAVH